MIRHWLLIRSDSKEWAQASKPCRATERKDEEKKNANSHLGLPNTRAQAGPTRCKTEGRTWRPPQFSIIDIINLGEEV